LTGEASGTSSRRFVLDQSPLQQILDKSLHVPFEDVAGHVVLAGQALHDALTRSALPDQKLSGSCKPTLASLDAMRGDSIPFDAMATGSSRSSCAPAPRNPADHLYSVTSGARQSVSALTSSGHQLAKSASEAAMGTTSGNPSGSNAAVPPASA
jgi:hypothetical protein